VVAPAAYASRSSKENYKQANCPAIGEQLLKGGQHVI